MRAAFNYMGGKARLGPWIAGLLPPHRTYLEPFAGSAAVLFAKRPSLTEIVNDLDGNVVCFFRVLRDRPDELARALRLTPYARAEMEAADLSDPALPDLERARRFFVRVQSTVSHSAHSRTGFAIAAQQPPGGGGSDHAHKFVLVVERLEACAERLRRVQLECRPAVDLIGRFATDPHTAIYADPPYLAATRSMRTKRPGIGDYRVEYASEQDHRGLAEAFHRARAAVLLSGYHSPLYDDLYADWWRVERPVSVPTGNGTGGAIKRAVEVVWSNRPLALQGELSFATVEVSP